MSFFPSASLPDDFGQLKKLEALILVDNSLTCLPRSFSNLTNLKTLTLSKNQFKTFPTEILPLQQLDSVDLSQNLITQLPSDMSALQAVELNLNQNQVRPHLFLCCMLTPKVIFVCQ